MCTSDVLLQQTYASLRRLVQCLLAPDTLHMSAPEGHEVHMLHAGEEQSVPQSWPMWHVHDLTHVRCGLDE
jgi:hypothetical protein